MKTGASFYLNRLSIKHIIPSPRYECEIEKQLVKFEGKSGNIDATAILPSKVRETGTNLNIKK